MHTNANAEGNVIGDKKHLLITAITYYQKNPDQHRSYQKEWRTFWHNQKDAKGIAAKNYLFHICFTDRLIFLLQKM